MFHITRMIHIIIIPAVNKNTPPWLGEGVSLPWASKIKQQKTPIPMVSDNPFLRGQLYKGHRNRSLALGTHGYFLC